MCCKRTFASLILATIAWPAYSVGLGTLQVQSALGEPLRASVPVYGLDNAEEIVAKLASPSRYDSAGLSYTSDHSGLSSRLVRQKDGQAMLLIESRRPYSQMHLDLIVDVKAGSDTVSRGYSALLDLPSMASQSNQASESASLVADANPLSAAPRRRPLPPSETPSATPAEPRKTYISKLKKTSTTQIAQTGRPVLRLSAPSSLAALEQAGMQTSLAGHVAGTQANNAAQNTAVPQSPLAAALPFGFSLQLSEQSVQLAAQRNAARATATAVAETPAAQPNPQKLPTASAIAESAATVTAQTNPSKSSDLLGMLSLGLGGLTAIGGLGGLWWWRKKRADERNQEDLWQQSMFAAAKADATTMSHHPFSENALYEQTYVEHFEEESKVVHDEIAEAVAHPPVLDAQASAISESDLYAGLGRYDEALSILSDALERDPSNRVLRNKIAEVHRRKVDALQASVERMKLNAPPTQPTPEQPLAEAPQDWEAQSEWWSPEHRLPEANSPLLKPFDEETAELVLEPAPEVPAEPLEFEENPMNFQHRASHIYHPPAPEKRQEHEEHHQRRHGHKRPFKIVGGEDS